MDNRSGMAIVIVLVFSMAILVLGSAYLKTVGSLHTANPKSLELMQTEYFAQGIKKLALLKFKKFPADFYHAYLHELDRAKGKPVELYNPSPVEAFHGVNGSILQSSPGILGGSTTPVKSYSTTYRLTSQNQYNLDVLEIWVRVVLQDDREVRYRGVFNASRTRIL